MNIDKINFLKQNDITNFSYADHIDANNNFSKILPVILSIKVIKLLKNIFVLIEKIQDMTFIHH